MLANIALNIQRGAAGRQYRRRSTQVAGYALLVAASLCILVPLLWILDTSFKTVAQATAYPPVILPSHLSLANFQSVFDSPDFLSSFLVTIEVTLGSTALTLAIAVPTAYALARISARSLRLLVVGLVLVETLPLVALVIPLYQLLSDVKLYDTQIGLILVYTAISVPFATWLNLAFLQSISTEVEEAAVVDGAGTVARLRYVILPLLRPAMGTTLLFTAIGAWNQFLVPEILAESRAETLTVYITQFVTQKIIDWGSLCAATVLVMLPIVLLVVVAQRQLVGGLTLGMLKG
jgi:ABC-type glycerol-3-phosphate transport system permease component